MNDLAAVGELIEHRSTPFPETKRHIVADLKTIFGTDRIVYQLVCGLRLDTLNWRRSDRQNKATYETCETCYFRYQKLKRKGRQDDL